MTTDLTSDAELWHRLFSILTVIFLVRTDPPDLRPSLHRQVAIAIQYLTDCFSLASGS